MAEDDDGVLADSGADDNYEPERDDSLDSHTVRARNKLREQMQADVERFLQSGGRIEQLPSHVSGEQIAPAASDNAVDSL